MPSVSTQSVRPFGTIQIIKLSFLQRAELIFAWEFSQFVKIGKIVFSHKAHRQTERFDALIKPADIRRLKTVIEGEL